jgi:hypothetical protein
VSLMTQPAPFTRLEPAETLHGVTATDRFLIVVDYGAFPGHAPVFPFSGQMDALRDPLATQSTQLQRKI